MEGNFGNHDKDEKDGDRDFQIVEKLNLDGIFLASRTPKARD